ncbi:hypothetical protein HanHA300_Chr17g0643271 [Helianthus annuus]|uniref:uncharacterized protein LOC110923804 n=1 Tax=Helianthus annuus TaxID=4232 RepID=UPI000B8EEEA7|nr:uncharacterized protein LOC110923804 [Helianthus annuus]KAJ0428179.1 hypothetical protein HanHA300_Chr17g0643271 [Helianthus annuus]KAJ0432192.1 hypothetical protein HanIR_Chr17g0856571 [Helianthus annuus]KAJ0631412.1 hypothetical protein HanLR1_Chr17g0653711 [Helianthus annuus]KAJ0635310.1 hypothetical protein HanOQP8_Chr17g0649441 [Helianthus annuus]
MSPDDFSYDRCHSIVSLLQDSQKELGKIIGNDDIYQLFFSCEKAKDTESSDKFSKPMLWIGIYIAVASFFCILAMAADLLHGFWNKKIWFPCKYFSLNAASITVITVTMKIQVDLSSGMLSYEDQITKVGGLAFMCIMMANLMPSLASMDNKTLLANIIGLCIFVITVIVNICIQINTGVINDYPLGSEGDSFHFKFVMVAYIYMAIIFLLLIMMISSSVTIPTSKEILESKYQATNKISLTHQRLQHTQMSRVEKLRHHVRRYWVMAETSSPQFGMANNPLSTASGVICVIVLVINLPLLNKYLFSFSSIYTLLHFLTSLGGSPYKWSTIVICETQSIGVVVGSVAPICRCFSVFSFKLGTKWNKNDFMFFKVEKYWTQKLHEWKQSPVTFLPSSRRLRSLIYNSKGIILSLCIGIQKATVILCKVTWLLVIVASIFVVSCFYRWNSLKARWFAPPIASRTGDIDEDLSNYVLQIDNERELAEKTLKGITKSVNSFISKAEKEQSINLLELLEKSTGFEGVEIFDSLHVQPLFPAELVNSWSLPIVTLTCLAVALPNIHHDEAESLLTSVAEGLSVTHLVEESLNTANDYVNMRKTTLILWHEVENSCKWLDNPLKRNAFKGQTTTEIIKWFSDQAKEIVIRSNEYSNGDMVENPPTMLIAANSMYRVTQTILLRFPCNIEPITNKQLFDHLNGMIADIFSACFTNIPRVIRMRCHESVIEKREASVKVAAKLLGKTTKIIERLETRDVPTIEEDKKAYLDEWRLYFQQSIP